MKTFIKISMIFTYSMLLICSTSYAMDYEYEIELLPIKTTPNYNSFQVTLETIDNHNNPEKILLKNPYNYDNFQIEAIDDIPKLPLKKICKRFKSLSTTKQNQLLLIKNKKNKTLAESLTFKIALLLPSEVQHHILTLLMGGDDLSAQLFHKTPFWYASKKYCEAKEEFKKIPTKTYTEEFTKFFNKFFTEDVSTNKPIAAFFRLSSAERQEIIKLRTPSTTPMDESAIIIDMNQQNKIHSYDPDIQKTFFANQDIIIMTDAERKNSKCILAITTFGGTGIGMVVGIVCGVISGVVTGSPIGYVIPPMIGTFGGGITGMIIGHFCYNRTARDESPRLEV